VALAIFVPLVWVYFDHKHQGPYLWSLGALPGLRWVMYVGMGSAFAMLVSGLARPSPASLAPGRPIVKGVFRVTRHPLFMAAGLYGLLHLLVVPVYATELAFFGGFPLFVWIGCRHQDQRKLAEGHEAFRRFHTGTPFLPRFRPSALLPAIREDAIPVAVGIAATVLLRVYHTQLFGG
jgi:uncharacterized membrane protein